MTEAASVSMLQSAILVALVVSLPLLIAAVASGLLAGMLQSLANVHDAAAGFAPRLLVTAVVALLLMGWMSSKVLDFALRCWGGS